MSTIRDMRGFLASSIGVTCAAALALPLTPPAAAGNARPAPPAEAAGQYVPGNTQSLPLEPRARNRAAGAVEQGLPRRAVRHFSLVGVVWDDPDTELHGRVQVRTRAADAGTWSGWQDLETHNADHAADPGAAERASGRVRGATAPLWVGESDGVEVRVRAEADGATTGRGLSAMGLRLELVDPGGPDDPGDSGVGDPPVGAFADALRILDDGASTGTEATAESEASAANAGLAPPAATEIPALGRRETERELDRLRAGEQAEEPADKLAEKPAEGAPGSSAEVQASTLYAAPRAKPYIGPRPSIVTRRGWGADEGLRERTFVYTKKVKAAFVHHTATGNNYSCSQVPSVIRSIYRYHVQSMGWRDIGYNFLIDRCGKIYEGRAGGVAKPVLGAHTLGFNSNSMGIAVLGSFGSSKPPSAAVRAVSRLTAWKLGLYGMNPRSKTYLKSGGGNLYRKGRNVRLNVISGHRDGFATSCPGQQLYAKLGSARSTAARYQGR